ncbi:MAG TPA: META domain-containing protein [Phototrophicaceae bacterium]|nr:META domain-containing protein [Phototrophicaceae bacterium]
MKFKVLLVILLLTLGAGAALAQTSPANTVSYNGFSFSLPTSIGTNVNIAQVAGDDPSAQQPGGPAVKHTEFVFYKDSVPDNILDGVGGIEVYQVADFNGYSDASAQLQNLQNLLAQKPDLSTYMVANADNNSNDLPFVPGMPAAQVIRARANYVTTPALKGISYISAYKSDVSPFTADEFIYTFQGLSNDGSLYIVGLFRPTTTLFPATIPDNFDYDSFGQQLQQYMTQSIATLNNGQPTDFTPSLSDFDAIIQSITTAGSTVSPAQPIQPAQPVTQQPGASQPTPAATEVTTDPTMGGLAGKTWTLVSYGDPANPTAVLNNGKALTLEFTQSGVNGNGGCNGFGGSFQYSGNSLTISNLIHTMMACTDQNLNDQENTYLTALSNAQSFTVSGDQLQITYDKGVLTFKGS